jgi:hypothetical protein
MLVNPATFILLDFIIRGKITIVKTFLCEDLFAFLNQIFWHVLGVERGSLSLMSTIEELLEKKK